MGRVWGMGWHAAAGAAVCPVLAAGDLQAVRGRKCAPTRLQADARVLQEAGQLVRLATAGGSCSRRQRQAGRPVSCGHPEGTRKFPHMGGTQGGGGWAGQALLLWFLGRPHGSGHELELEIHPSIHHLKQAASPVSPCAHPCLNAGRCPVCSLHACVCVCRRRKAEDVAQVEVHERAPFTSPGTDKVGRSGCKHTMQT